jgi:hypothetical protein
MKLFTTILSGTALAAALIFGAPTNMSIKALYADFNTKLSKGQLVALIDPEIFEARVNLSLLS